jgi:hypothetical protein
MLRVFMETNEDEITLHQPPADFDPVKYLLEEHMPGPGVAAPPPCAAHQPEGCAQTSAGGDDDDVVEFRFSLEEFVGFSPTSEINGGGATYRWG